MTTEAEEVEELRGRLTAFMVNYPDVQNRVRKTVNLLTDVLNRRPGIMPLVLEDLSALQVQLSFTYEKVPEVRNTIRPIMELLEKLMAPAEMIH